MANAQTDGEALIPLDRGLFEPATASTDQDAAATAPDAQSSAPAEPAADAHGPVPGDAGQSPDDGSLVHLDREFFSRATGEPHARPHDGHGVPEGHDDHAGHADHMPADHTATADTQFTVQAPPSHGDGADEPHPPASTSTPASTSSETEEPRAANTPTDAGDSDPGQTTSNDQNLTERTVDGQHLLGSDTQDGGWISQDGTVYVSGDGTVEHGLTAPDGSFLANGEVRQIDGDSVYGTRLDDGSFLSEDGKTMVTAGGVVEHGQTTADGQFVTERAVDGQDLWGSDTQDGGWISQDGTVYVSSDGTVEHGLTAPDGSFLANGEVRQIDGDSVYGT
ncbi:hypothetical protein ACIQVK_33665, partial [Streptomyces sp. NPDC090493]|uniref:hypothetical protein n=1 Tax=Streptomyces sp. NPDC090493 TaxID=3365964 RepID=UPI003807A101